MVISGHDILGSNQVFYLWRPRTGKRANEVLRWFDKSQYGMARRPCLSGNGKALGSTMRRRQCFGQYSSGKL